MNLSAIITFNLLVCTSIDRVVGFTSQSQLQSNHAHPNERRGGSGGTTRLYLDGEGMAGKKFNKHLLGDVLRALQPSYLNQVKKSIGETLRGPRILDVGPLVQFLEGGSDGGGPPSWEDLSARLGSRQSADERRFRERLDGGREHSPLATRRVFSDRDGGRPIVTFYRDSASWCPYCQKVWIALEEKQIPYEIVKVDMNCYAGGPKPASFQDIQPSGSLPCAVIRRGGENGGDLVVSQSDDILATVDGLSTGAGGSSSSKNIPNLLPLDTDDEGTEYMRSLCDDGRNSLERRLYGEWMWYLTGKRKPVEYRERFEEVLDEVDSTLASTPGPYFMGGKDISMADIKFIPFIERQASSLLYFKGFQLRDKSRWPNIVKWLETMESRPSYRVTRSDAYSHSRSLPPQLGSGCTFYDGCEEMQDAVDAYCLPTDQVPSSKSLRWREPGWEKYFEDAETAKREAAERIIFNQANICKFAARAAGTPGLPAAAAELADPKARSNLEAQITVDAFLRYAIGLLLAKDERAEKSIDRSLACATDALGKGGDMSVQATIDCLDYVRQRIGVPRDMSYPAAQELRQVLLRVSRGMMEQTKLKDSNLSDASTTVGITKARM